MNTQPKAVVDNIGSQGWQVRTFTAICRLRSRTPVQKVMLFVLASHCNGKGQCWPSVERLMLETGLGGRGSVQRVLSQLERLGDIRRIRRRVPMGPEDYAQTGDLTNVYEVRVLASLVQDIPRASDGGTGPASHGRPDRASMGGPNVSISDLSETSPSLLPTETPPSLGEGRRDGVRKVQGEKVQRRSEVQVPNDLIARARHYWDNEDPSVCRKKLAPLLAAGFTPELVHKWLRRCAKDPTITRAPRPFHVACHEPRWRKFFEEVQQADRLRSTVPRPVIAEPAVVRVPIIDPKLAKVVAQASEALARKGRGN